MFCRSGWRRAFVGGICFAFTTTLVADGQLGKVVAVVSGDMVTVRTAHHSANVRLAGIDAPEQGQPYADRARRSLAMMTFGRHVRVVAIDTANDGELSARLYVAERDISAEMVRAGYAWAERQRDGDFELLRLEREAREIRLGLWASDGNVAPWQWRAGIRTIRRNPAQVGDMVVADRNSKLFHLKGCPGASEVLEGHRLLFPNRATAEASGYRLDPKCR